MKRFRQELSIDMVVDRDTLQNNQITLFPVLPSYLRQVMDYLEEGFFMCSVTPLACGLRKKN